MKATTATALIRAGAGLLVLILFAFLACSPAKAFSVGETILPHGDLWVCKTPQPFYDSADIYNDTGDIDEAMAIFPRVGCREVPRFPITVTAVAGHFSIKDYEGMGATLFDVVQFTAPSGTKWYTAAHDSRQVGT